MPISAMQMRRLAPLFIPATRSQPSGTALCVFVWAPASFISRLPARLRLTQNAKVTRVTVASGTVGFVSVTSADIELQTPVALVRPANGQRAQGQVTVTGPNHMIVSAYSGALLVERNGESRIVEAGKSYNVSFDPNATPSAQQPAGAGTQDQNENGNGNNGNNGNDNGNGGGNHRDKGQLIFDTVVLGATAVAASSSGTCDRKHHFPRLVLLIRSSGISFQVTPLLHPIARPLIMRRPSTAHILGLFGAAS